MISGLTSLIFGDGQPQAVQSSPLRTPDIHETHVDDDWVLFSQTCTGHCKDSVCKCQESLTPKSSDESVSPKSITPCLTPMEGSWLVTPPPCFMSRSQCMDDVSDVRLIENLLIEHPSMSVYNTSPAHNTERRLRTINTNQSEQRTLTQPLEQQLFGCVVELRPQWLRNKRLASRDTSLVENCVNSGAARHNKSSSLRAQNKHLKTFKRKL